MRWRYIKRYRCPFTKKLKTMVKRRIDQKLRLRNFDARHGNIETGPVVKSRKGLIGVERGRGICYKWKEKACVRRETSAVSSMRVMIVHQNRHRKPLHPLSHQWHEVEVRREKEAPEAEVRLAEFFDNRADTIWKVLVRYHFVSIGIFPSVKSLKTDSGCKAGDKCLFPHFKVEGTPN